MSDRRSFANSMEDRNLAYLSLVEVLYGYPLDGVVLLTGCDKTTPAQLMAAATVVSSQIFFLFFSFFFWLCELIVLQEYASHMSECGSNA